MSILKVNGLKKIYVSRFGTTKTEALKKVDFSVEEGEYVAIMGESGSGKTTLLNIIAALDKPTAGSVLLDGKDIAKVKDSELAEFRRNNLGFVFQDFNLLDTFTVEDNIFLPLVLAGKNYKQMSEKLKPIAANLGITEVLKKYPYEISGGQKQRAAVARALITNPKLVLADEPTGALDSKATEELLRLFGKINMLGQTIIMVPIRSRQQARQTECCLSGTERFFIRFSEEKILTNNSIRRSPTRSHFLRRAVKVNERRILSKTCT